MAIDLGLGSQRFNAGLRAVSICENQAVVTAWSNDVGFDDVFGAQIRLLGKANDVLILISASGNSPSILRAYEAGSEVGLDVITLTGFDGGRLRSLSTLGVHVETQMGDYGPVEDAHLAVNHWLAELLRQP